MITASGVIFGWILLVAPVPAPVPAPVAAPVPAAAAAPAPALTADKVVERIQAFYERTSDFSADFKQIYTYKAYKRRHRSKGKVYFKKPGRMRWDYESPTLKHFISDGATLWIYEPEEKQVFRRSLKDAALPVSITFLWGKGDLRKEFEPKLLPAHPLAKPGSIVIELTPRTDKRHYKKIVFVVDAKSFAVTQTLVYDPVGNVNDITFTAVKTNVGLPDDRFGFKVPAGVTVLEGDESPAAP